MSRKTKIKTTPKIKTYKQNPLYWKSIIGLDNIRINNAKKYITRKNNEKIIKNNQEKKIMSMLEKVIHETRKLFRKHGRLYNVRKTIRGKLKNKLRSKLPMLGNESPMQSLNSDGISLLKEDIPEWYMKQHNWDKHFKGVTFQLPDKKSFQEIVQEAKTADL
jgi:hypothetical protein